MCRKTLRLLRLGIRALLVRLLRLLGRFRGGRGEEERERRCGDALSLRLVLLDLSEVERGRRAVVVPWRMRVSVLGSLMMVDLARRFVFRRRDAVRRSGRGDEWERKRRRRAQGMLQLLLLLLRGGNALRNARRLVAGWVVFFLQAMRIALPRVLLLERESRGDGDGRTGRRWSRRVLAKR